MRLERLEVVVDLLARDADPGGDPGGGGRDHQLAEKPGPDRIQRGGGCLCALDDLDVLHETSLALTIFLVKALVVSGTTTRGGGAKRRTGPAVLVADAADTPDWSRLSGGRLDQ